MEDEVLVTGIEPKITKFRIEGEGRGCAECDNYDFEVYELDRPITRKPEYLAMGAKSSKYIKRIVKIDPSKSDFANGIIVPKGRYSHINVLVLKLNSKDDDECIDDRMWYTSFKTLLMHTSIDEFTEERSPAFRKVVVENMKILCNGSECKHIIYCKFFNDSQTAVLQIEKGARKRR